MMSTPEFRGKSRTNHGRVWLLLAVGWLTIASFGVALGAEGSLVWARQAGGNAGDNASEYGRAVAVDGAGNVIVVGSFPTTVDFDPGPGVSSLTSAGNNDIFVWKLSPTGSLLWRVRAGGTSGDVGYGVAVDVDGNVIVTGSFFGTVDFNPGATTNSLSSGGSDDVFVWKLSPTGSYLWARRAGGTSSDIGYGVTVDDDDNVVVTGRFHGTVDFDPGAGTVNLTNGGNEDVFAWKLDPNGNLLWARQAGSTSNDTGYGVAVDNTGNVIVTGIFASTADFDPGAGTSNLTSNGNKDAFVWKLTTGGALDWAVQMGSTLGDYGNAVVVDSAGNVITTGYFQGTADFDPGVGSSDLTTIGAADAFVWKLDPDGNLLWARAAGGTTVAYGYGVAVDSNSRVIVTGFFESGTVDFDPGIGTRNLTSNGGDDAFVWELDSGGNLAWANQLGGITGDHGSGVTVDASDNVIVTGFFSTVADFDPGAGTTNLTSIEWNDIFVWKLGVPPDTDGDGFPDTIDNFPAVYSKCRERQATQIGDIGPNVITGTAGDDVLMGFGGADTIDGLGGEDLVCAGGGADTVHGGDGKDKLYGEDGADTMYGDEQSDHLYGGNGNDILRGNGGTRDRLFGGDGIDDLNAGTGTDDRCTSGEAYANCEITF